MTVRRRPSSPRCEPAARRSSQPASISSICSLGAALVIAFAWLAFRRRRRGRRAVLKALARAMFSRRVLLHRSTFADLAYCVIGLATLRARSSAGRSSRRHGSATASPPSSRACSAPAPQPPRPSRARRPRTLALFLAYDLGFFVDHSLKHRIPALWELHKAHHSAEVLTPLVNFRVHPLNSLILANNLSLFIGVIGGAAHYALGRQGRVIYPVRPERADARSTSI